MRRFLILLIGLLVLGGAAYALYQRPEIRALFEPAERKGDALDFLKDLPEISPPPPKEKAPTRSNRRTPTPSASPSASPANQPSAPAVHNQVPNDEVAHVMMAILAAKKLGRHLSISVTDDRIIIYGEVGSEEEKQQIRDILEKGRETRRVDTEHLVVQ